MTGPEPATMHESEGQNGDIAVAVLGTGRMGAAMAGRLARSGFGVVLWNRTGDVAERVAAEVGATVAATAAAATEASDVVVASLADDAAVEAVHLGPSGSLEGAGPSSVVVDTSTVDPGTVDRVASRFAESGARFLDSPVSGSVALIESGSVTSMTGGDAGALATARPVVEAYSGKIFHLGASGSGAAMKLAVNALVHSLNLALCEALVLAESTGIDRALAYEVIASSAAGSPFIDYKRTAFERPDETPVAFSLDLVAKDLSLITALARRVGVPVDQLDANAAVTDRAIETGLGEADMSALAGFLRRSSGHA